MRYVGIDQHSIVLCLTFENAILSSAELSKVFVILECLQAALSVSRALKSNPLGYLFKKVCGLKFDTNSIKNL